MKRVLLVSPHFPPDSSAATHRVRLLAPHLHRYGWDPTVLSLDPSSYEGLLDVDLPAMLPPTLRVVRCRAFSPALTRRVGIGDLGLRSLIALYRAASRLLRHEHFDALFITIFPAYTALLGPLLTRRFHVPFVLDYQDPWVSAWGKDVGGGIDGQVDFKSRMSRRLAERLEPVAVRAARGITAVSAGTYAPILARNPGIHPVTAAIPIGAEPADFADRQPAGANALFDPADGLVHICATGTILPLGNETLHALLTAVAMLRDRRPELYSRVRLHFVGTSNQTVATSVMRVLPMAAGLGVAEVVREYPTRMPYSAVVHIQRQASALLALGSSETHYTASKIFPLLLAGRPLLAAYHEDSSAASILAEVGRAPSVRLVTYSDQERAATRAQAIFQALAATVDCPVWNQTDVNLSVLSEFFAENLAGRLAAVFDQVSSAPAA